MAESGLQAASATPMARLAKGTAAAKGRRYATVDLLAGFTLVAPQAIGFGIFVFLPILAVFVVSFFDWNLLSGEINPAGLHNYVERLPGDARMGDILRNTAVFVFGFMPPTVACGLGLAVLTNRQKPGMPVYRAI